MYVCNNQTHDQVWLGFSSHNNRTFATDVIAAMLDDRDLCRLNLTAAADLGVVRLVRSNPLN